MKPKSDLGRLLELVEGYRSTCLLAAAQELGLFDELEQGPCHLGQLAEKRRWHLGALMRAVDALASLGLLEGPPERTSLTPLGRQLLQKPLKAWLNLIREEYLPAWTKLSSSLQTGQAAFPEVFGQSPWQHRREQAHLQAAFESVTASQQRHLVPRILRHANLPTQDFCLGDLGGGQGHLLKGLLEKTPRARGWLLDLKPGARPLEEDPDGGYEVIVGSFFEPLPQADIYLLKHVLHNWPDPDCLRLLQNCAKSLSSGARLLIIEDLKDPESPDWERAQMDLHMLVMHGGQERSLSHLTSLLDQAGLRLTRHLGLGSGLPHMLEVVSETGALRP